MSAIKTTLVLITWCFALPSNAGDITGRVTLKGTPPPERVVDLKSDATLAARHPNGLMTRHYQASPDGGLRNVLVYVRGTFDGMTFEQPRTDAVLDHSDGLFQPYVMGLRIGQPFRLKCSDETICSFHTTPKANQAFAISPFRDTVTRSFTEPEVPVRVKCDLHPWNYAYVGVFAHPFFVVTDERGQFTIRGVPAGQYALEIFHPWSGTSATPIVVTDKTSTVDFEVIAK